MPQSIVRFLKNSEKKHVFITGSRGSGKSTLAAEIAELLSRAASGEMSANVIPNGEEITKPKSWNGFPGITTFVVPGQSVILEENMGGRQAVVGRYDSVSGRMRPVHEGFEGFGCEALGRCAKFSRGGRVFERNVNVADGGVQDDAACNSDEWIFIDELGYLESECDAFCQAVKNLLGKRRVVAVLRKQSTAFLDELRSRTDALVVDVDEPVPPIGCVIMASGLGRRFGGNKLLAGVGGKSLIEWALEQTQGLFAGRVVVTRHEEIAEMCGERGVDCVLHQFGGRNDTVRLGVSFLQEYAARRKGMMAGYLSCPANQPLLTRTNGTLAGYLFCPADQPFLTRETVEVMLLEFGGREAAVDIVRPCSKGTPGAPILFGADYAEELKTLPQGKGGSYLARKYPQRVRRVEVAERELWDVDTEEDLQRMLLFG